MVVGGGGPLQFTTSRTNQELVDATSDPACLMGQKQMERRAFVGPALFEVPITNDLRWGGVGGAALMREPRL